MRSFTHSVGRAALIVAVAAFCILTSCAEIDVGGPPDPEPVPAKVARVGAAVVDITPPPGMPSFGFSDAARTDDYRGYRTRLRARAIVLSDESGRRLALVTVDLGCVSGLLQRLVADRIHGTTGITADRILLAATHTHCGPAGFNGESFYNLFGGKGLGTGYDEALTEFLVAGIARAIESADADRLASRGRVVVTTGARELKALTRNRSREAWQENRGKFTTGLEPRAWMVRVDEVEGGERRPKAAFVVFAGHPTVVGPENDLWHGDVFGLAASELSRRATDGARPVVLLANGAEGDVSFAWKMQNHHEAERLAGELADELLVLYRDLGREGHDRPLRLAHAFETVHLPGADAGGGERLCRVARMGLPTMGGAEDGRSDWHGKWVFGHQVVEGARYSVPRGCHGHKIPALGILQSIVLAPGAFPRDVPLQVLKVGDLILAAAPFELTTESGARVAKQVAEATGRDVDRVVAVSLANEFAGYLATPEEYDLQHYEGSSTAYGRATLPFVVNRFAGLGRRLRETLAGGRHVDQAPPPRSFRPGRRCQRFPDAGDEDLGERRRIESVSVSKGCVDLVWTDVDPGRLEIHAGALVRVETRRDGGWVSLVVEGRSQDDVEGPFEVRCLEAGRQESRWRARWFPPPGVPDPTGLRFRVLGRSGRPDLIARAEMRGDDPAPTR